MDSKLLQAHDLAIIHLQKELADGTIALPNTDDEDSVNDYVSHYNHLLQVYSAGLQRVLA